MQLAGTSCAICREKVVFESEATWCVRCAAVLHTKCIAAADGICPACRREYDRPEAHFVFSQKCPECLRPNAPPEPQCKHCHARTRWDSRDDYAAFLKHMQNTARRRAGRGLAELCGGGLCMLALVLKMFISTRPFLGGTGILVLGFITLSADGIYSLMRSRQLARFR